MGVEKATEMAREPERVITLDDYQNIFGRRPWGDYE